MCDRLQRRDFVTSHFALRIHYYNIFHTSNIYKVLHTKHTAFIRVLRIKLAVHGTVPLSQKYVNELRSDCRPPSKSSTMLNVNVFIFGTHLGKN